MCISPLLWDLKVAERDGAIYSAKVTQLEMDRAVIWTQATELQDLSSKPLFYTFIMVTVSPKRGWTVQ